MSDIAVRVEDLGKQYRIGERAYHRNIREAVGSLLTAPYSAVRGRRKPLRSRAETNTFWALRHVSFELKQGELLGIIGHNGAGKSTLLKILSRITEPTEGIADVRGRVRTLLEVGTGFHPELTGRENVMLNGAILGMKRVEIARKFDEIVSFAAVERFIDTPVKWYSSGMYTRLAFSVAAHLEPDILIVDEVLAVGDVAFRNKCLAKMQEVGNEGRTVFFVSHMLPAISQLCQRAILLDGGRLVADGPSADVIAQYMEVATSATAERQWLDPQAAPGTDTVRLRSVRVRTEDGRVAGVIDPRHPVALEMQFEVLQPDASVFPSFQLFNSQGICLFLSTDHRPSRQTPVGQYTSTCWIPGNLLAESAIKATAIIGTRNPTVTHVYEQAVVTFEAADHHAEGPLRLLQSRYPGVVRPQLQWRTERSDSVIELQAVSGGPA